MKTNLILVLVFILVNINCNTSETKKPNDLELENLKGAVSTITLSLYKFSEMENKDSNNNTSIRHQYLDKKHVVKYNINGFITEKTVFNWDGSVVNNTKYEYLENNRLVSGPEGEYLYDESGKLYLTIYTHNGNGLKKTIKYDYDSENLLADKYVYNYDNELVYHYSYKYDSKNLLKEFIYRYYGHALTYKVNQKEEYFYDSVFNLVKIKTSGLNTSYSEFQEFKYNERKDTVFHKTTDSSENEVRVYTYDYEYDSQNNWVKKSIYSNNKIVLLKERTIEYYP